MGKLLEELKNYFANATPEQLEKDWKFLEQFDNCGPTVKDFIEQMHGTPKDPDEFEIKRGDWFVCIKDVPGQYCCNIREGQVVQAKQDGVIGECRYNADEYFRPWAYKDVKEGDLLVDNDGFMFLFKKRLNDIGIATYAYWDGITLDTNKGSIVLTEVLRHSQPATPNEHRKFFDILAKHDLRWDWERKELVKKFPIERNKWYVCVKNYISGGRRESTVGDVVQALGGMSMMALKDGSQYFRPWTIDYAKEGDILTVTDKKGDKATFIFAGIEDNAITRHAVYEWKTKKFTANNPYSNYHIENIQDKIIRPATTTEVDTFNLAMDYEEYMWDKEKNALVFRQPRSKFEETLISLLIDLKNGEYEMLGILDKPSFYSWAAGKAKEMLGIAYQQWGLVNI